jgi:hypothetical protein
MLSVVLRSHYVTSFSVELQQQSSPFFNGLMNAGVHRCAVRCALNYERTLELPVEYAVRGHVQKSTQHIRMFSFHFR